MKKQRYLFLSMLVLGLIIFALGCATRGKIPANKTYVKTKNSKRKPQKRIKANSYYKNKKARLIWPIKKPVLFRHFSQLYEGISLGAPAGTKVFAVSRGKVLHAGSQDNRFGNIVILEHSSSLVTIYANLSQINVRPGVKIQKGEIIGKVGRSGGVQSPRVHFEVRQNRKPVNPLVFLPKN